eukprot:m.172637 g.172637  ORF g.172637 m.172637 type:complete len:314 (+) comp16519_c1_seq11:2143-3084(+)
MFRGGIPDEYRVPLWQFLVRMRTHSARRFKKLGYYKRMLDYKDTSRTPFPQADQIGVDLQRTFPSNIHFQRKEQPLMQSLDRILRAFGWHNPRVGYCQGLGQVAGFALLILEEEDAFWALAAVVEDIMTWQYYCAPLLQAHLDVEVFLGMIEHYLPALHRHFASVQLQDNLFFLKWFVEVQESVLSFKSALGVWKVFVLFHGLVLSVSDAYAWFMPVFVRILPAFVTFVIWDALLVEGREALFRFGLAILKLHEADLLKMADDDACYSYLKTEVAHTTDVDRLCFYAYGWEGVATQMQVLSDKLRPLVKERLG